MLHLLAWEGCSALRAHTYVASLSRLGAPDVKLNVSTRPLLDDSSAGQSSTWELPGWLANLIRATAVLLQTGASFCLAYQVVWSLFSISAVSLLVSQVRLDKLLSRKPTLFSTPTGTKNRVGFPFAALSNANVLFIYLPRVRPGGRSALLLCYPTIFGVD